MAGKKSVKPEYTGPKAIETTYKGYRFRSRLEARWAVFLSEVGLLWSYETEGFDLDGLRYLPDFKVDAWHAFVEVKPDRRPTAEEEEKARRLAWAADETVLLLCGNPWPGEHRIFVFEANGGVEKDGSIAECLTCFGYYVVGVTAEGIWWHRLTSESGCPNCDYRSARWSYVGPSLRPAFEAARGARFEFGESGR